MSGLIPFVRRSTLHDWVYDIDRFFEPLSSEQRSLTLAGDIEENEEHILMSFDFPGMKQGDFSVKVEGNKLILAGERKREVKESDKDTYTFHGRQFGSFYKAFALPQSVDRSKIEADYRDGVLRVVLPKAPKEKPQAIEVKVGGSDTGFFSRLLGQKDVKKEA